MRMSVVKRKLCDWLLTACRSSWTKGYNTPLATPSEPESSPEPEIGGRPSSAAGGPVVRQSSLTSHRRLAALRQPSFGRPLTAIPEVVSPRGASSLLTSRRAVSPLLLGGSRSSTPSSVERPPSLDWGDGEITPCEEGAVGGPQRPVAAAASGASSLLPAVWRGIGQVVPQLRAMLRQTRVATALVMVMSAISLEAGEVWEARRRLKRLLKVTAAEERWQLQSGGDIGGSAAVVHTTDVHTSSQQGADIQKQRDTAAARSASLLQHVASLNELFLSVFDGQPEEEAVMALLNELKVARIRTAAREAFGIRQQRLSVQPAGTRPAPVKSALGLPSLALRKRVAPPKASASSSEASLGPPTEADKELPASITAGGSEEDLLAPSSAAAAATAAILGQLESRALLYSRAFESFSARFFNAAATAASAAAGGGAESLEVAVAQQQQQMESHASRYLAGFGAVSRRFASRQLQLAAGSPGPPPAEAVVAAPLGIPALPPRKKKQSKPKPKGGMKARRQAQAQVDVKKWKTTSRLLA